MTERKALGDAIGVGGVNDCGLPQVATALWTLGLAKVATACATAQHFATGGDFESLGHGFLCLDTFGTSHNKSVRSKRARNIGGASGRSKRLFGCRNVNNSDDGVKAGM